MQMRSLHFIGLFALAAVSLRSQSQIQYWSTVKPDCSSLMNNEQPVKITDSTGGTLGYSCYVSGTFVWLAAGGVDYNPASWATSIRVAAPGSGDIDADYTFYDRNGNPLTLDNTLNNDPTSLAASTEVEIPLFSNQPLELELLGLSSEAPDYTSTAEGSVYATFYCPDAVTCANVLPQLIYSALPTYPWSLSVPVAWDDLVSTQWSAEGIDDGGNNVVSLVVYNEDQVAARFGISVYDSDGNLAATGSTPTIPPLQNLGSGNLGQGGTYAALLSDLVSSPLPSGVFKVVIDGGSTVSAVEVLQINGSSATTLQVAFDSAPGAASASTKRLRSSVKSVKTLHVQSMPRRVGHPRAR